MDLWRDGGGKIRGCQQLPEIGMGWDLSGWHKQTPSPAKRQNALGYLVIWLANKENEKLRKRGKIKQLINCLKALSAKQV
jgi:hypothetical protein